MRATGVELLDTKHLSRFKDKTCYDCKKKGHIAKVYQSKPKPTWTAKHKSKKVHQVSEESDSESDREDREGTWGVDTVEDRGECVPHISVCVQVDGKEVTMEFHIQGMQNFSPAWLTGSTNHQLWWADRTRRPNQGARKEYRPRATDTVSESSDSEPEEFALNDWDRLFTD